MYVIGFIAIRDDDSHFPTLRGKEIILMIEIACVFKPSRESCELARELANELSSQSNGTILASGRVFN